MRKPKTIHNDDYLFIKLPKHLMEDIRERAKELNLSVSAYVRLLCQQGNKAPILQVEFQNK